VLESRTIIRNTDHSDANIKVPTATIRPAGLEPATDGLENRCSIHLSYGRNGADRTRPVIDRGIESGFSTHQVRPAGFEPATCGLGNRRSILLSYERELFAITIFRHQIGSCQPPGNLPVRSILADVHS
jgi:hypothetical protein